MMHTILSNPVNVQLNTSGGWEIGEKDLRNTLESVLNNLENNEMNGYNLDFAVSAKISDSTVKEMIRKVVEEQTGRKVATITFETRDESGSFDRYSRTVFAGCTVMFVTETSQHPVSHTQSRGPG